MNCDYCQDGKCDDCRKVEELLQLIFRLPLELFGRLMNRINDRMQEYGGLVKK